MKNHLKILNSFIKITISGLCYTF